MYFILLSCWYPAESDSIQADLKYPEAPKIFKMDSSDDNQLIDVLSGQAVDHDDVSACLKLTEVV